jgi:acyl carrier protein
MDQEQIKTKLTNIISDQLGLNITIISSKTTLSDLCADYLEQAEILLEIEKEFGFDFQNYVKMGVESFDNLCLYVEMALKQNNI